MGYCQGELRGTAYIGVKTDEIFYKTSTEYRYFLQWKELEGFLEGGEVEDGYVILE